MGLEADHFLLPSAVWPLQPSGEAAIRVPLQTGADEGRGAEAAGEGRDHRLRRGRDNRHLVTAGEVGGESRGGVWTDEAFKACCGEILRFGVQRLACRPAQIDACGRRLEGFCVAGRCVSQSGRGQTRQSE